MDYRLDAHGGGDEYEDPGRDLVAVVEVASYRKKDGAEGEEHHPDGDLTENGARQQPRPEQEYRPQAQLSLHRPRRAPLLETLPFVHVASSCVPQVAVATAAAISILSPIV